MLGNQKEAGSFTAGLLGPFDKRLYAGNLQIVMSKIGQLQLLIIWL